MAPTKADGQRCCGKNGVFCVLIEAMEPEGFGGVLWSHRPSGTCG